MCAVYPDGSAGSDDEVSEGVGDGGIVEDTSEGPPEVCVCHHVFFRSFLVFLAHPQRMFHNVNHVVVVPPIVTCLEG